MALTQGQQQATYTEMQAEWLRRDLRRFVPEVWHLVEARDFKSNWHLDAICDHLAYVTLGDIRNLIINVPPRQTKSLTVSVIWPTWWWADEPEIQFMYASYSHDLALRDAVKARDIIQSGWYQERYGGKFYLDPGQNQKSRYVNDKHGYRISTSVGGKTTGEGGDVLVIDDPHNMMDVHSDPKRHSTLSWYDNSWRSRLNDPTTGQKVIICQRSHDMDLVGHILDGEEGRWVTLMLPNEYDPKRHCRTFANPKGRDLDYKQMEANKVEPIYEDERVKPKTLLNPQRFGDEETKTEKAGMSIVDYEAQYNQDPEAGGGLILKRKWWRQWSYPPDHPKAGEQMPYPEWDEIISVYDTAFKEKQTADYSARTTWGMFWHSVTGRPEDNCLNMMLLERMNERLSFPDLRDAAIRHEKGWDPDHTLIEDKASGQSLIQEFETGGIPVWKVKAGPEDLTYRAHMVSGILRAGRIFYVPRDWAYSVISQCVAKGTLIICRDGVKPVENVKVGDEVLTHKGRWRPVLKKSVREANNCVKIKGKTLDPVTMTAGHPVYASECINRKLSSWGWVKAGSLTPRAYRKNKRGVEATGKKHSALLLPTPVDEQSIQKIDLREWMILPGGKRLSVADDGESVVTSHWRSVGIKYRQQLDHEFGWVLGMYLAEGCSSRSSIRWSVNSKTEQHFIDRISRFFRDRVGDVGMHVYDDGSAKTLSVSLPLLSLFFDEFGRLSHNKKLPSWIWDAPNTFLTGLLDGWFAGDGYDSNSYSCVTSTSIGLVWQMRLLAQKLGIHASIHQVKTARKAVINGREIFCRDSYVLSWRKSRTYTQAMSADNGSAFSLKSVEQIEDVVEVYNFDVAEDHSYTTTGGVVHNCAKFPMVEHDDLVATCVIAWAFMRRMGDIELPDDEKDNELSLWTRPKPRSPYG